MNTASNAAGSMFDVMKATTLTSALGSGGNFSSFIYLTVIQFIFELTKHLCTFLQTLAMEWWNSHKEAARKKVNSLYTDTLKLPTIGPTKFEHTFVRRYGEKVSKAAYIMADAILNEVRNHPAVQKMSHNGDLITIGSDQEIQLAPGIWFAQQNLQHTAEELVSVTFTIWTTVGDAKVLYEYENTILKAYQINQNNQLGSSLYYFDQWSQTSQFRLDDRGQRSMVRPTCIRFTKHLFTTGRRLTNIFFRQRNLVQQRFRWFMDNKPWYDARGIPHTLGMLLHGAPGCGKTSTIKAIANESQRHIVNVNFARLNSKSLMKKLFYDPNLTVVDPDNNASHTLYVPVDRRVYVVEDADAVLESVLLKRTLKNELAFQPLMPQGTVVMQEPEGEPDPSDGFLSFEPMSANSAASGSFASFDPAPVSRGSSFVNSFSPADNSAYKSPFSNSNAAPKKEKPVTSYSDMAVTMDDDDLDLATLLNILDGTLETPGRILILTSNHPEMFDEAFLRPGRMDLIVKFEKCDASMLHDMTAMYYDDGTGTQLEDDEKLWEECRKVPEGKWTPAEVSCLLLKHHNKRQDLWEELREGDPSQFSLLLPQ